MAAGTSAGGAYPATDPGPLWFAPDHPLTPAHRGTRAAHTGSGSADAPGHDRVWVRLSSSGRQETHPNPTTGGGERDVRPGPWPALPDQSVVTPARDPWPALPDDPAARAAARSAPWGDAARLDREQAGG
ncbi:hypothetical protein [Micromonospora sp. WMMD998]|uniref:hypothetical protein n=1 Tax=Micromonospora sp. WMMD998 TaxID=3016092 RepID=UPI00249B03DB|nr:hypothetical protein [Micromonospora sp. WMMD998]WFE40641.1 hypothetical protein O7619_20180 [Micromonospora sp. WMMD998]